MLRTDRIGICLAGLLLAGGAGLVLAQEGPGSDGREGRRSWRDREGGWDRGGRNRDGRDDNSPEAQKEREERRQRWDRYRTAPPEERRKMRVDGWVRRSTRTYELDEGQQALVRAEIETMQRERREQMGPAADEFEKLQNQMFDTMRKLREQSGDNGGEEGGRRGMWRQFQDNPEVQQLRERMNAIEEQYPFDWEASSARIEKLLPPEQAGKGRARREERMALWRERRQDWESRRAERDARRNGTSNDAQTPQSSADGTSQPPQRIESPLPPPVQAPSRALHPWERYVQDFIRQHNLNAGQNSSANAILKEVLGRASALERSNESKVDEAYHMSDPVARQKRIAELNQPMDSLFEELKGRLDVLLTSSQRGNSEAAPPAAAPAKPE